jgi:competence protein ComEC
MAAIQLQPALSVPGSPLAPKAPASIWRAPLVPLALAGTVGIVLDRHVPISIAWSLLTAFGFLLAWFMARSSRQPGLALAFLLCGVAAAGAARHRLYLEGSLAADSISRFAQADPQPILVRGALHSEPIIPKLPPRDPLRAFPESASTRLVLQARELTYHGGWEPVAGLVQVTVAGRLEGFHLGNEVEMAGLLATPSGPANPGEFDYAAYLRDQGIGAVMVVRNNEAVTLLRDSGPGPINGWLNWIGNWCKGVLDQALPAEQAAIARALLLGDGSAMTGADWDKYLNTGVIHVLAISGQHLVVLGTFAWLVLRLAGIGRRRGALAVAGFLLGYALLVGARPPVMRAAWTVLAIAGGMLLTRPVMPANSFALAWILVAVFNPTDVFNSGCLLSFLAVAVLFWGTSSWQRRTDPLEALIEESRPMWLRTLRKLGYIVLISYAVNLAVWLAVTPLVAQRFHLVSPVALIIGPPMVLLTSIALLAGFMLLLLAPLLWPLALVFAGITQWSLAGCEALVDFGLRLPGAYWYVPDVLGWWLWLFYAGLVGYLTLPTLRQRRILFFLAGLAWLAIGLGSSMFTWRTSEFRCTFVAVGHGGCTVLETPHGRTLLYDAGAISGPDVTRRQIAGFLWSRGIRRIDELFLSHADLDHFNGVPALLDRFAVGQVTCTPTFAERATGGVQVTLDAFRRHGISVRIVRAGDRLTAGNLAITVLHPPAVGPEGKENARSMVLLIQHAGHSILLTGDLEDAGLQRVLSLPPMPVDVFMAPHHGSLTANTPALAKWANPKFVVSCQRKPKGLQTEPYTRQGARFLGTWPHGAVTIRSSPGKLIVETFKSKERWEFK